MRSSQVRDLARRYATGKLSQESYRSQRRSLIDSITDDRVPLAYRQDVRMAAARPRFNIKLLGLAMVAIVVAGVCAALFLRHSAKGQGGAQAPAQAAAAPALVPHPGPDLVHSYVETDDWTDSSLRNFEHRWDALGPDEQTKARDNPVYGRLTSEVRQQIDSEKAVAGSDGAADAHLVELQKLAKILGVSAGP
jgi:hypothetical protein